MGYIAVMQFVGNICKVMLSVNFDSLGVKPKSPCWEECCTHEKVKGKDYGDRFDHEIKGNDSMKDQLNNRQFLKNLIFSDPYSTATDNFILPL